MEPKCKPKSIPNPINPKILMPKMTAELVLENGPWHSHGGHHFGAVSGPCPGIMVARNIYICPGKRFAGGRFGDLLSI